MSLFDENPYSLVAPVVKDLGETKPKVRKKTPAQLKKEELLAAPVPVDKSVTLIADPDRVEIEKAANLFRAMGLTT